MTTKIEIPAVMNRVIEGGLREQVETLMAAHQTPNREELLEIAGHRLALDLECLLTDCKDFPTVSKWFDQAHEAIELWKTAVSSNAG